MADAVREVVDLDVQREYLLPLARAGYQGPLVLQTFGLTDPPEEHLRRSLAAWRRRSTEAAAALGAPR